MNIKTREAPSSLSLKWILLTGLIAGLAEVIWVSLYAALTPVQGIEVAREITVSVFGGPVGGVLAPGIGTLIHFILSCALVLAFAAVLSAPLLRLFGRKGVIAGATVVLAAIWAMNFFVVLPVINPVFVTLMPLPVTLVSKLLFGLSLGVCLALAPSSRRTARKQIFQSAAVSSY